MMNGSQEHAAVDNARRLAAEAEAEQRVAAQYGFAVGRSQFRSGAR
jgi:hypothetical protein